jgi:hypothetical protein
VRELIVGQSTLPQEIKLVINKEDIRTSDDFIDFELRKKSFFVRVFHRLTSGLFLPI